MKIFNRKFRRDYQEVEKYEAGIVLTGAEVKSIRTGGLRLDDSYVKFLEGEPYLINAEIVPYRFAKIDSVDPKRNRKILLHNKEMVRIQTKLRGAGSLTVVPVSCYNRGDLIKLEIALARGRKEIGRRKYEKEKDIKRSEQRETKEYIKS